MHKTSWATNARSVGILVALLFGILLPWQTFAVTPGVIQESGSPVDQVTTTALNGQLRVKYVFVSFGTDVELTENVHQATVDMVSNYMREQSYQNLTYTAGSGIVFRPGEGFAQTDSTPFAWRAEKPAMFYRSVTDSLYLYGDGQNQAGWYSRTGSWWYHANAVTPLGEQGKATHLNSEILWKIQNALPDSAANPFHAPPGEAIDLVFMVYLASTSPIAANIDGLPSIYLNVAAMLSQSDYFGGILHSTDVFSGSMQRQSTVPDSLLTNPAARATASAYAILHETFHRFSLGDGPPGFQDPRLNGRPDRWYIYGYNNLMCQQLVGFKGIPVLGLPWLAKMNAQRGDWVDIVDFTGENLKKEVIYDIRSQGRKPRIYKYSRQPSVGMNEYFLIAFHGGIGLDAQDPDQDGKPMLPSTGLEIYHCVDTNAGTAVMYDIESAFGTFTNISFHAIPPDVESRNPGYYSLVADPALGRDNYDYWTGRDIVDMASHSGYEFDFFSIDLPDSQWQKSEFSFQSLPNSFWYDTYVPNPGEPQAMLRRESQSSPNSMVIRIREQYNSSASVSEPYAVVDFLSAPYEEILTPGASLGEVYALGDTVSIGWGNLFGTDIRGVTISTLSQYPDTTIVRRIARGPSLAARHSYQWFANTVIDSARIQLTFSNTLQSGATCAEICDFPESVKNFGRPTSSHTFP